MSVSPQHASSQSSPDPPPEPAPAADMQRLWAPWRMDYVGGGAAEPGCIFCNRLAGDDDAESLIFYRGESAFVIMNLFPYNTGHVMIVPNAHVASPASERPAVLVGMADLLPPVLRALEQVLTPAGFNVGMNIGAVAGAGVAGHLHEHVVPRWVGDANFMPVLASTMVLPEMIPVTYAKVRAELQREMARLAERQLPPVAIVTLSADGGHVLLIQGDGGLALPRVPVNDGAAPVWRVAANVLAAFGITARLVNWAGSGVANSSAPPALLFVAAHQPVFEQDVLVWLTLASGLDAIEDDADRRLIASAIAHRRPPIAAPPDTSR